MSGDRSRRRSRSREYRRSSRDYSEEERYRSRRRSRSRSLDRDRSRRHGDAYYADDYSYADRGRWGEAPDSRHAGMGHGSGSEEDVELEDYRLTLGQDPARQGYLQRCEAGLRAGLDGQLDAAAEHQAHNDGHDAEPHGRRPGPTSIFLKNIPSEVGLPELYEVFRGFPSVHTIKMLPTGRNATHSRGVAVVGFSDAESARQLMESSARHSIFAGGVRLQLDYSFSDAAPGQPVAGPSGSHSSVRDSGGSGDGSHQRAFDWLCPRCSKSNFARRIECYHCSCARPANPQRVQLDMDGPSNILKVSGLEPHLSEEELRAVLEVHATLLDLRFIKDKYTGIPRGFAFAEFATIAEANRVLQGCQDAIPPGQTTPLRLCFGRDRASSALTPATSMGGAAIAGLEAIEAAQAQDAYASWQPKEFDEEAAAAAAAASAAADAAEGATSCEQQQQGGEGVAPEGYSFDAASGYWYAPDGSYYFDAKSGLYYSTAAQQWYRYDHASGQYVVASDSTQAATEPAAQQTAEAATAVAAAGPAAAAPSTSGAAPEVAAVPQASTSQATASVLEIDAVEARVQAVQAQLKASQKPAAAAAAAAVERKRAVIGAAAQYNPQGLLAKLAQEEKEEEDRAKAAAVAAKKQRQQQAAAATRPMQGSTPVVGGPVQGVIRRGKWAQRNAAA